MSASGIECRKCGVAKDASEFHKRGDGLRTWCKACEAATYKAWSEANRDKRRAINDRYEAKNPERTARYRAENSEKRKESVNKWRAANYEKWYAYTQQWLKEHPECGKEAQLKWRASHREESRERTIEWRKENHERANAQSRIKRARKEAAEGHHTAEDIQALWIRQEKRCAVPNCPHPIDDVRGSKHRYHVDHIIPLKPRSGPAGTNWPSNLQILCPTHNVQKKNRDPREWMRANGLEEAAPEDAA